MAKLDHKTKLSARAAPSLNRRARDLVGVLQDEGFTFQSSVGSKRMKVGIEGMLGAVLLEFLARPVAFQIDIIRRRLPEYEALCQGVPAPPPAVAADAGGRDTPDELAKKNHAAVSLKKAAAGRKRKA